MKVVGFTENVAAPVVVDLSSTAMLSLSCVRPDFVVGKVKNSLIGGANTEVNEG